MSDFLSFIVVEHIQFFHGALQFFSNVMIILYDHWSYRIIIALCTLSVRVTTTKFGGGRSLQINVLIQWIVIEPHKSNSSLLCSMGTE